MNRFLLAVPVLALIGLAGFLVVTQPRTGSVQDLSSLTGDPAQGEMVFWAAGCASCHMAPKATGAQQIVLSGGQQFASPFGSFLAPNISPDPTQGIGGWTLNEFAHALRDGVSPAGQHLFPALPYSAYNKMAAQDLVDLKAFLDTLPASAEPSQPHQVGFPFNIRRSLGVWKLLFVSDEWVVDGDLSPEQARGRYIVEALAHCGECHTPRNALGGLDRSRWLAGAPNPEGKGTIPNITPAKLNWSPAEIVTYLTTGFTPEFDSAGSLMSHVVANMARLPEADVRAVAAYLKAVPAVE